MMPRRIVVVGASAGGFAALRKLFSLLEPNLPATLFAVVHTSPLYPSYLPQLLGKFSKLPIQAGAEGPFEEGVIYVAPPDYHLVVERRAIRLSHGPKENRSRPALDVTFRSAALAYGPNVLGVVLTGMLDDGTAGLFYIKRHGGVTVAQDPVEAEYSSMPSNAIAHVKIDHILPLAGIAALINGWTRQGAPQIAAAEPNSPAQGIEAMLIEHDKKAYAPTDYTCPECHGPISHIADGSPTRFRCRVGHAYGLASLTESQSEFSEQTLWTALQALEAKLEMEVQLTKEAAGDEVETAALKRRMAETQRQMELLGEALNLSRSEKTAIAE